jgi:hypothetical protein
MTVDSVTKQKYLRIAAQRERERDIWYAELMHSIYEKMAPEFGYETSEETREFDPDSPNGRLMTKAVKEFRSIACGLHCSYTAEAKMEAVESAESYGMELPREREAAERRMERSARCGAPHPTHGWRCDLKPGHDGPHQAGGVDVYLEWEEQERG